MSCDVHKWIATYWVMLLPWALLNAFVIHVHWEMLMIICIAQWVVIFINESQLIEQCYYNSITQQCICDSCTLSNAHDNMHYSMSCDVHKWIAAHWVMLLP